MNKRNVRFLVLSVLTLALAACNVEGGEEKDDGDGPTCTRNCGGDGDGGSIGDGDGGNTGDGDRDGGSTTPPPPADHSLPQVYKSCGPRCLKVNSYYSSSTVSEVLFWDGHNLDGKIGTNGALVRCTSISAPDSEHFVTCTLPTTAPAGWYRFSFKDARGAWAQYGSIDQLGDMCDASQLYCTWYNSDTNTTFSSGDDKCDGFAYIDAQGVITFRGNAGKLDAVPSTF